MDDLIQYRLESAEEKLTAAKLLLDKELYKDSVGRSYYSIFSSMRAILALKQVDFSKHAGVISYFQREFIKTNIFDKKYSKYIQQAFQIRNSCDYDDFFIVSRKDAEEQYKRAEEILKVVKEYIDTL